MSVSAEALALLTEEANTLERTLLLLQRQRERNSDLLSRETTRARDLTSEIVNAGRAEDKQLLASDEAVSHGMVGQKLVEAKALETLLKKPYFARIILEEETDDGPKTIEYKIGYAANPDCRIIDWKKAPLSKLYYEYKEGDDYSETILDRQRDGRVALRNTVDIEAKVLRSVSCRYGTFANENGTWIERQGKARAGRSGGLPDVLSLITAEQFRLITEEAETAVLIQGVAGSGKTTVALYRLAWLLGAGNSELTPADAVVCVQSGALRAYINSSMPILRIEGVKVVSLAQIAAINVAALLPKFAVGSEPKRPSAHTPQSLKRLFSSMAILLALEDEVDNRTDALYAKIEKAIPWSAVPSGITKLFEQALRLRSPIAKTIEDLTTAVQKALTFVAPSNPGYSTVTSASTALSEIAQSSELSPQDLIAAIFKDTKRVLGFDESRLLNSELIQEGQTYIQSNWASGVVDPALDPLLLRLRQLLFGNMKRHDGKFGRYHHLLADEVQDLSGPELACVIGSVEKLSQLTLVGDIAQRITATSSFPGWEKLRTHWSLGDDLSKFVSLEISHRSTLPIMRFADALRGENRSQVGREGRVPLWFQCKKEETGIRDALAWIQKAVDRYPTAVTAVLCRTPAEARLVESYLSPTLGALVRLGNDDAFSFEQGVLVTDVAQAKGLEFVNVVMWNPSEENYPADEISRNLLYVAATRAEENLCLVTWHKPSPLLRSLTPDQVRLVIEDLEEES